MGKFRLQGKVVILRGECITDLLTVMAKIVVADRIAKSGVDFLRAQEGFEVVESYGSSPQQILELVADADALVVRSETQVTAEVLAAGQSLKVVGRAGVGVDNIDVEAATERGVIVLNTPSGNTVATAELTFTHILCGTRPIVQAHASMRAGEWDRKKFSGQELAGKTLGVCGLGRIGTEVAKRAQAFGMRVLAYDPYLTAARAKSLGIEQVDIDQIYAEADYITFHLPLTESTRHIVDEKAIASMKKGVRLFNCARGGIIKESALVEGLKSGKVAAAGLDVFEDEPLASDHELRKLDNVVLTPHLGASTREAQESVGIEVAEAITEALRGGVILNAVNMPSVDRRTLAVLRPYLTLGIQLGKLLQQVAPAHVEKLIIRYFGKVADLDAMPLSRAIQKGFLTSILGPDVNDVNAPLKMKQLGIEVDTVKSNTEGDYTELVELEAHCADGELASLAGTLISKAQIPRVVALNGRAVEFSPFGYVLILENEDVPGIVGMLGTVLGRDKVNIANLSLSRSSTSGRATAVYQLDSAPSEAAMAEIAAFPGIASATLVKC